MENEPWSPKMSVCLVISGRLQLWRHSGFNFNARTNQKVCSDQHSAGARSKLPHDHVTLLLIHVAMLETGEFCEQGSKRETPRTQEQRRRWYQSRDGEVSRMHLLCQPVDFSPGVEEDDSLGDRQRLVQITQGVQLPLLETEKQTVWDTQVTARFLHVRKQKRDVTQGLETEDTGH